jgi:hypothetical protein
MLGPPIKQFEIYRVLLVAFHHWYNPKIVTAGRKLIILKTTFHSVQVIETYWNTFCMPSSCVTYRWQWLTHALCHSCKHEQFTAKNTDHTRWLRTGFPVHACQSTIMQRIYWCIRPIINPPWTGLSVVYPRTFGCFNPLNMMRKNHPPTQPTTTNAGHRRFHRKRVTLNATIQHNGDLSDRGQSKPFRLIYQRMSLIYWRV